MLQQYKLLIPLLLLFSIASSYAQSLGDPDCATLLMVSGFNSDNVKIYDGCSGEFIRDLDNTGTLAGPQAIIEGPDSDVFVVSEKNHRVLRFDRQTLRLSAVVVGDDPSTPDNESTGLLNPTGAAFDNDGLLYVGSFSQNLVQRFDPETGADLGQFAAPRTGGLQGIDAGMRFGPDGNLNIPGFDSDNVVRVDAATGQVASSGSINAGSGGLNAPRVVLFSADGQRMLVSSWANGRILEYNASSGAFIRQLASINTVTGMALGADNTLFVTSDQSNTVLRLNASSGALIDTFIPSGSGQLNGATFIHILTKQNATPTPSVTPQQFWLTGLGQINDRSISVERMQFTTGGIFGNDFSADDIIRHPWGSVTFTFTDCNTATMSYTADLEDSGLFGSGGYTVIRVIANAPGDSCLAQGFENVTDGNWMTGAWANLPERSGEGFFIDAVSEGRVIVVWFNYMPIGFSFPTPN